MSLDDEYDDSFFEELDRIEALASRNLLPPPSFPTPAPQPPPPSLPPTLRTPPPPPQATALVVFDESAEVLSAIPGFSPPHELSQRRSMERSRTGDDFEMVEEAWGDFGNADLGMKNDGDRELERLKRELMRVSKHLKNMESECAELQKDRAKKEEQLKRAREQIEAKEIEICNLQSANREASTRLSSMKGKMLSGTEHTPLLLPALPSAVIANKGLKERKIEQFACNREDSMMAPTLNDTTLSTSKSIGVQTECIQGDNINNDHSTPSESLFGETLYRGLQVIWGSDPANQRLQKELMSSILVSCSEDIFAPFDNEERTEASTSGMNCSDIGLINSSTALRLHALVMKMHNQTAQVHHVVEELLNLCRVKNASAVAISLKILRTLLHHLLSFEAFSNQREYVPTEPLSTGKQGEGNKNEYCHVMDSCLLRKDANFDNMIDLPSIWWIRIFDAARETVSESFKESSVLDALSVMILVVMRSDVNTDRAIFELPPILECVHQLLSKEVGPFVKTQAVYLLFLILNCPNTLALFCTGGRDDMDALSEKMEGQSEDDLQKKIGLLLRDLGKCLSIPLNGSMELKLVRQVIVLLAYIASYGKLGFEFLLGPIEPSGLNFLELILQVLSAKMNLPNTKERNSVMREALIILNRLASNPIYSKSTLEALIRSKSCASLTIDIVNWIPRMGRNRPHRDNTQTELEIAELKQMELDIADLARIFSSRLLSYLGER
ncbi:protein dimerization [Rhynchospora pubera]|uniref:Protein dimerization n=2 Tax=Rhynchospora pubera TaxID=906938 RepID=A0AAV8AS52_9POAL|nr:protein dimerization [Rhynchospora pubera]